MPMRLPPPASTSLADMVNECRRRRALLNGQAGAQVTEALVARYGPDRAALMPWVDTGSNPYPGLHTQLAALYDDTPRVSGGDLAVSEAVRLSNHWGAMQRNQRDTLALRELFVLAEVHADAPPTFRVVYPDLFDAIRARRGRPREVGALSVWIESPAEDDTAWELWEYQIEDVEGVAAPLFRRTTVGTATSTRAVVEELAGAEYPYVRPDGHPFIPGVLYHASISPRLLDWQTGTDTATGAIKCMLDSTAATSAFDDGCYRIHVAMDGDPVGASSEAGRLKLAAAPGTILRFVSSPESGRAGSFHTLEAPADPEMMQRVARTNVRDLAASMGVTSSAVTRESGEVKSAASLIVSAAERAALQRKQKPVFMPADQELLTVVGWLMGVDVEPTAWRIEYPPVQLDPSEMLIRQQVVAAGRAAGTMSKLDAILYLNPSFTEAEAAEKLAEIEAETPKEVTGGQQE